MEGGVEKTLVCKKLKLSKDHPENEEKKELEYFKKEARLTTEVLDKLDNEFIIRIENTLQDADYAYMMMEYAECGDLGNWIDWRVKDVKREKMICIQ